MNTYHNLTIIGTSHIAIESVKEVRDVILKEKPEIVALELDRARFKALIEGENEKRGPRLSDIKVIGLNGYVFSLIGAYAERKLGEIVGVKPGDEMKEAAQTGKDVGARIALIDQRIEITLRKFSKEITLKEKLRLVYEIIKNIIKRPKLEFDLKKVPEKDLISKLLKDVKEKYPNVYSVLVDERNKFMAKHLYTLMQKYKVVAVVGAGHEDEIIEEIKCLEKKRLDI